MTLYGTKSVRQVLLDEGQDFAVEYAEAELESRRWGVYHVQRAWNGAAVPPRSLELLVEFPTRAEAEAYLGSPSIGGGPVDRDAHGIARVVYSGRPKDEVEGGVRGLESFYVAAPVIAESKTNRQFESARAGLVAEASVAQALDGLAARTRLRVLA